MHPSINVPLNQQRSNNIDPDFTIPVSIRVTDVNDNAPSFVGSPYTLNISELSLVGARVFGGVEAVDRDQGQNSLENIFAQVSA